MSDRPITHDRDDLRELGGRSRQRGTTVLVAAAGLLAGALIMNLASPPETQVVEVTQRGDGAGVVGESVGDEPLGSGGDLGSAGDSAGATSGTPAPATSGAPSTGGGPSTGPSGGGDASTGPSGGGGGGGASGGGGDSGGDDGEDPWADVRGVTADTVKIGFAFFNVGNYSAVPQYDVGPTEEKLQAVLERWRREGRDVLHGREIEAVAVEFSITEEEEQRAACKRLVEDEKVFAVAAPASLYAGTDCVTKEFQTPLVQTASTGGSADKVAERAPYFFMVAPDRSHTSRNWAHWAHERGLLEDKTIGVYYSEAETVEVKDNFLATLEQLGYGDQIAVDMTAPDGDEVGPEDSVAVNQFRSEGVDLAILVLNGFRMENFMQQAESQAYRPEYIASDLGVNTDDTKTTTFPPAQWDGTYAMTSMYYGMAGNTSFPSETQICYDDYRDQGRDPEPGVTEWNYAMMSCHALEVVWQALDNAGRDLNVSSYIAGMEQIQGYAGAFNPGTNFGPGDHTGSDLQRTLQWHRDCGCYQPVNDFAPFWVA